MMMTGVLREQSPAQCDDSAKLRPEGRVANGIENELEAVDAEVRLTNFLVPPARNADGWRKRSGLTASLV